MPLAANPLVNPGALDVFVAAGVANQGVARLLDSDGRPYKWDTKDTAGAEGATQTYRGWKLGQFKVRFEFWTADQIEHFFSTYVPQLRYDATKQAPNPIAVGHPIVNASDVNAAIVQRIGPLVDLGQQLWSVTVEFEEYRPPKKKNVTTTPSSKNASPSAVAADKEAQVPPVILEQRKQIARLREQWNRPLPSS